MLFKVVSFFAINVTIPCVVCNPNFPLDTFISSNLPFTISLVGSGMLSSSRLIFLKSSLVSSNSGTVPLLDK